MRSRLEAFCGKHQHIDENRDDETTADNKSGPAVVARNLKAVLPSQQDGVFYSVVTDRFYTSVQGAIQLLARGVYTLGTILANKAGYCAEMHPVRVVLSPRSPSWSCNLVLAQVYMSY
jgi:hypothetical protein